MKLNRAKQAMLRALVRKTAAEISRNPSGGYRSLLDSLLRLSGGSLEGDFVQLALRELQRPDSVYARWLTRLFVSAEPDLWARFGVNFVYSSFGSASRAEREPARRPWLVCWTLDTEDAARTERFALVAEEAAALAVFVHVVSVTATAPPLRFVGRLGALRDSAFVLLLTPEACTPDCLTALREAQNVMPFVQLRADVSGPVQSAARALRAARLPFGLWTDSEAPLFDDALTARAADTGALFLLDRSQPVSTAAVSARLDAARRALRVPLLPVQLYADMGLLTDGTGRTLPAVDIRADGQVRRAEDGADFRFTGRNALYSPTAELLAP